MPVSSSRKTIRFDGHLFVLLSWLHMTVQTWPYLRAGITGSSVEGTLLHWLVWLSYSLLYLIPAIAIVAAADRWLGRPRIVAGIAVIVSILPLLFIEADRTIYDLYNFHFNSFVLNLLITPGGIASLGSGNDTYFSIAMIVLRIAAIQIAIGLLALRIHAPIAMRRSAITLGIALLGQGLIYGVSDIRNDGAILDTAKVYPLYQRITFRSLASHFGYKPEHQNMGVAVDITRLDYPLRPLQYAPVRKPPNIVLLVAESLRWDRLTPEIMPNTWAMAQRAQHFTEHYSSGNGTREGLFGMFYGLYGSYWENFLHAQRGPLLMDRVQALNYQLDLRTSARFSYPEFDKTLFANVPPQVLHEANETLSAWQNDEANAGAVIDFIGRRDPARPFMSFFFLESTHARYNFPDSAVIAKPYLESVNYSDMSKASLAPQIGQLKNRYTNAAHWVDKQVGRIVDYLAKNQLLDNTIIIVTGDHGEEFLEKGFWGHNSSFVEEQTHTPMVVWMPGMGHAEINRLTSHLDIGTTLLQQLGAPADANDYSLGRNLFDASPRPYIVVSDWHSIGVHTADMKYRIPYNNRGTDHWQPTATDDSIFASDKTADILNENRGGILDAMQNCSRFSRTAAAHHDATGIARR
jgi:membrane-anchored protein YejM (alkaline phosphatase superfamily)